MEEMVTVESVESEYKRLAEDLEPSKEDAAASVKEAGEVTAANISEFHGLIAGVLTPSFKVLAPNWGISEDEIDHLAGSYAVVMEKYFPDLFGSFGAELGAVLMTSAVILPRMKTPRKAEPIEAEAETLETEEGASNDSK